MILTLRFFREKSQSCRELSRSGSRGATPRLCSEKGGLLRQPPYKSIINNQCEEKNTCKILLVTVKLKL